MIEVEKKTLVVNSRPAISGEPGPRTEWVNIRPAQVESLTLQ